MFFYFSAFSIFIIFFIIWFECRIHYVVFIVIFVVVVFFLLCDTDFHRFPNNFGVVEQLLFFQTNKTNTDTQGLKCSLTQMHFHVVNVQHQQQQQHFAEHTTYK